MSQSWSLTQQMVYVIIHSSLYKVKRLDSDKPHLSFNQSISMRRSLRHKAVVLNNLYFLCYCGVLERNHCCDRQQLTDCDSEANHALLLEISQCIKVEVKLIWLFMQFQDRMRMCDFILYKAAF